MNARLQKLLDIYEVQTATRLDRLQYEIADLQSLGDADANTRLILKSIFTQYHTLVLDYTRQVFSGDRFRVVPGSITTLHALIDQTNGASGAQFDTSDFADAQLSGATMAVEIDSQSLNYSGMFILQLN
jgi:hypothetical protein